MTVMDRRALVLGGGGITGIAWETGLIAGLAALDIDLAAADVIIGTSAGSVVGTDIASGQGPRRGTARQPAAARGHLHCSSAFPVSGRDS